MSLFCSMFSADSQTVMTCRTIPSTALDDVLTMITLLSFIFQDIKIQIVYLVPTCSIGRKIFKSNTVIVLEKKQYLFGTSRKTSLTGGMPALLMKISKPRLSYSRLIKSQMSMWLKSPSMVLIITVPCAVFFISSETCCSISLLFDIRTKFSHFTASSFG